MASRMLSLPSKTGRGTCGPLQKAPLIDPNHFEDEQLRIKMIKHAAFN